MYELPTNCRQFVPPPLSPARFLAYRPPDMLTDRPILLLALGQTLIWAGMFYLFPASLLWWEADLGWSRQQLTLAITLAVLASGLAAPLSGRMIDRDLGPTFMGLGAILGGICLMSLSRVTQLWQFHALWTAIGVLMSATLYEATFAMITRSRGAQAKPGIVRITLIAGFAGTISFPTVHWLAGAMGWRAATALIGAFLVCVVAPMLWLGARGLKPPTRVAATATALPGHTYLRDPVFWLLGLGFAVAAIIHGATLHHLMPLLAERSLPRDFAVLIAALIGPMQVIGRLAMVAAGDRLSHHSFTLIAFGLMGGSVLALFLAGAQKLPVFAFVLMFGSAYGTISILRPVLARDLLGEAQFGAKSGGLAAMYMLASASSAWLGALVWTIGGYGLMLGLLLVFAALSTALYLSAHKLALRLPLPGRGVSR